MDKSIISRIDRYLKIEAARYSMTAFKTMPIKELEALYLKAKKAYYNTTKPIMTDPQFDQLEDVLKQRKPKSKLLQMVGAPIEKGRKKVKLPAPMSSLAKMKPEDADSWLAKNKGPYILSDKEDGISLQIVEDDGIKIYSRGRSNKGDASESWGLDFSHMVPYLKKAKKIGKLRPGQKIRAELLMSPSKFKKWAKEFENERNILGAVTKTQVHPSIADVDIVVYKQLDPVVKPSKYLPKLKSQGWNVVPYKIVKSTTASQLSNLYADRKKKSKWNIDGIVVEQDLAVKPSTDDPKHMRAFKENSDDAASEATVIKLEWNTSRHGLVVPTVIIKPIRLGGVTVNRATGWNARRIINMGIGPGAIIKIVRSGEVIPHIIGVIKKAKANMPTFKTEWDENNTNLRLVGSSDIQQAKGLVHFFKTINVDHLKIGTANKLFEAGLTTPVKVIKASESKIAKAIGSTVVAAKIKTSINEALAKIDHVKLIDASGIFGLGIGSRKAAKILRAIPYSKLSRMSVAKMTAAIAGLEGFTEKTAAPFAKSFPKYIAFVDELGINIGEPKAIKATGTKLKGQKICFSGFRDKQLEEAIIKNGGEIASGVSRNTTMLIYTEQRDKYNKAQQLGITTLTLDKFKQKYKL